MCRVTEFYYRASCQGEHMSNLFPTKHSESAVEETTHTMVLREDSATIGIKRSPQFLGPLLTRNGAVDAPHVVVR